MPPEGAESLPPPVEAGDPKKETEEAAQKDPEKANDSKEDDKKKPKAQKGQPKGKAKGKAKAKPKGKSAGAKAGEEAAAESAGEEAAAEPAGEEAAALESAGEEAATDPEGAGAGAGAKPKPKGKGKAAPGRAKAKPAAKGKAKADSPRTKRRIDQFGKWYVRHQARQSAKEAAKEAGKAGKPPAKVSKPPAKAKKPAAKDSKQPTLGKPQAAAQQDAAEPPAEKQPTKAQTLRAAKAAAKEKLARAAVARAALAKAKAKAKAHGEGGAKAKPKATLKATTTSGGGPTPKKAKTEPPTELRKELEEAADKLPGKELTKEERRAALMRFIRARDTDPKNPRKDPMPQEIKDELKANSDSQDVIFRLWVGHKEDFAKIQAIFTRVHRHTERQVGQERWKTWSQLLKHYGDDEETVQAIVDNLPEDHKRRNPRAPKCDAAVQYWVLLEDGRDDLDEDILEQGIKGQADIPKLGNEEFLKKAFSAQPSSSSLPRGPSSNSGTRTGPKPETDEERQEKDRKKAEALAKAEAKKKELEKNIPLRAQNWLKNINSDIGKLQAAIAETKKVVSKEVGATYKNKFMASQQELFKLRTLFEKNQTSIDKKTVREAEKKVKIMKTDLLAWGKVKQFYLKE